MAEKHPYMSGSGGIVAAVTQLRKAFPAQVNADTLKKLSIAPNNESYLINILRFIGVLDEQGKKTTEAAKVFNQHDDGDFQKQFAPLVQNAYQGLFELHGEGAWTLPSTKLISFFRSTDDTSEIVGKRQATTFQALAGIAGHAPAAAVKTNKAPKNGGPTPKPNGKKSSPSDPSKAAIPAKQPEAALPQSNGVGLTVRIEVNLPASADQDTYDKIFKSIRANLLNG